jgi:phage gp46-like protein
MAVHTLKVTLADCDKRSDDVGDYCTACAELELRNNLTNKITYTDTLKGEKIGWIGIEKACEKAGEALLPTIKSRIAASVAPVCTSSTTKETSP